MRILNMKTQIALRIFLIMLVLLLFVESKTTDLYKVLGVDSKASQREIQKAFHKLSLQYHPDKNKAKDAQEKFAEINNAYDILSDEEKRKKYDLYGGEKRAPRFDTGGAGDHGGYTHFTNSRPGENGGGSRSFSFSFGGPRSSRSSFNFRSDDMEEGAPGFDTGGAGDHGGYTYFMNSGPGESGGGSRSFSFSFGGPSSSRSSSNFGSDDFFSNTFGGNAMGGSQFGGFGSPGRSRSGGTRNFPQKILAVNAQVFRKEVAEKGITWLLLFYTSAFSSAGMESYEYLIGETTTSLEGALKVGRINCEIETSFCKELGVYPGYEPKIFVYSYRSSEGGSLVEYNGEFDKKSLQTFCREHLPKFSKRVNLGRFYYEYVTIGDLPKVLLLSTKKDTPVIWRTLSGLYRKQFAFYDAEVHDVSDPTIERLGVDSLPAIVGWLSNGEKHTIKAGISVKDLKSAVQDLSSLLENFEKLNKAASARSKKMESGSKDRRISLLSGSNFDDICGEKVPVCVIGVFRSPKAGDELGKIFSWVSEKSLLTRRQNAASGLKDSVSYALLDAAKQKSFLTAFDKTGFKSADKLLLAYKPRKGKFATSWGEITVEKAEDFIGSVLNGDVHFSKTQKRPILK